MGKKEAFGIVPLATVFLQQVQKGKTAPALFTCGILLLLGAFFSPIRSEIGIQNGATWMVFIGFGLILLGSLKALHPKPASKKKKPPAKYHLKQVSEQDVYPMRTPKR